MTSSICESLPTQRRARRGFTLTEIAIVLGIIGIILGAIWVAAAAVYSNMRIGSASRELLAIVQGMRALHATSTTLSPTANLPMTQPASGTSLTYMHAGVLPSDTLDTGVASTATKATNPWGGVISIQADTGPSGANTAFVIVFDAIPSTACVNMLTATTGAGRDPGLFAAGGGVAGSVPAQSFTVADKTIPASAAASDGVCTNDSNAVAFWFALRN